MSKTSTQLHAKIDASLKAQLEQRAAAEGVVFNKWLSAHLNEIVRDYPNQITVESDVVLTPPQVAQPYIPAQPTNPNPPYYPQFGGYQQGYQQPDAIDQMINEMRKMFVAKMMRQMLKEESPNVEDFRNLQQTWKGETKSKEDMSMAEIMKMNMLQSQIDRQYDRELARQQERLEMARNKGDKGGENDALNMITALATSQANQSQAFMQQFMMASQTASQTQQTLFTTALSTNRQNEQDARMERNEFNNKISDVQNQMTQTQLAGIQKLSEVQISNMTLELERIRNNPAKDPFTQLIELDAMRKNSPILDAAFKGAFGIKEGGGIGDLLPKLKELGVDRVIDGAVKVLTGMVSKPQQQMPSPMEMPPPMTPPTEEELSALHLPQQQVQQTENVPIEQELPDNIGYNNLQKQPDKSVDLTRQAAESSYVPLPATESVPIEEPEQRQPEIRLQPAPQTQPPTQPSVGYNNLQINPTTPDTSVGKVFTTSKKKKD